MIGDIWTMMWKESKAYFSGSHRTRLWPVIFLVIFGVAMPVQTGRLWLESPISIPFLVFIPFMLVSTLVADSFAGERERHTLETLLASRLSDHAILFGKMAAVIGYSWGMAVAGLIASLIAVNVSTWSGQFVMMPFEIALGGLALSFLVALLMTGVGIIVSLRASSVRQAQQILGLAVAAVVWIPIVGLNVVPDEWKRALGDLARGGDLLPIVVMVAVAILVVDVVLVVVAMARFQRSKLTSS
ncbi:MAG: ABC transporter permease [Chloroflexota bacterium]